jgi:hypothetical protein
MPFTKALFMPSSYAKRNTRKPLIFHGFQKPVSGKMRSSFAHLIK